MRHVEKQTEPLQKEASLDIIQPVTGSEKRVIISLLLLFGIIAAAALVLLYTVPYYGFARIFVHLPLIMAILTALVGATLLGTSGCLWPFSPSATMSLFP